MLPKDLVYAKTHEWARMDKGTNVVTVGITDFAAEQLGDIVYLELPTVGTKTTQETAFGVIESVKAAVDLYAPVTGEVVEVHTDLTEKFDVLRGDPYGEGWMIKIRVAGADATAGLMDTAAYQKHLESEGH